MARSSTIGSRYVVLVLTEPEARALAAYLPSRVEGLPSMRASSSAVNRAIRALRVAVDSLPRP